MREEIIRKEDYVGRFPSEIAVVEKVKYYIFQNLRNHHFFVNDVHFTPHGEEGDTINTVSESDRRTIIANKYVEKGFLQELDENGIILDSVGYKGEVHKPITDKFLLDKINSRTLDKYLDSLTSNDISLLERMKKLCLNRSVTNSAKKYIKIDERFRKLNIDL